MFIVLKYLEATKVIKLFLTLYTKMQF